MPASMRALWVLLVIAGLPGPAFATALADMQPAPIEALQRRLADAACYAGPIDRKASAALDQAIAACPSQEPQLRIETGRHAGFLGQIGVDQACRLAATGAEDKTIRLWSLPEGRLLRTLRMPIGPDNEGKVYAVALSPDGRFVAAGGWDAQYAQTQTDAVTIFDAAGGQMVARVGAFTNVIKHLVFSADGHWLAATLFGNNGVSMIDASTWKEVAADKSYGDGSYGAAFGPDGRLYTVAYDGKLRRYGPGPGFEKELEVSTHGGAPPFSVAIDPGGRLLAVGYDGSTKVDVYEAQSLAFRFSADTRGLGNGNLGAVAWLADGNRLVAGGGFQIQTKAGWKSSILSFGRDGRRRGPMLPLANNTITNLMACGAGFAVTASDPAFGLVAADGKLALWRPGLAPDMRGKLGNALMLAQDGKSVRSGLGAGAGEPVLFDLAAGSLTDAPGLVAGLAPPRTEGLRVTQWESRTDPQFGGVPIVLDQYELSRSLAIQPDAGGFVLGTQWYLRSFDASGQPRWRQPGPGEAWGVAYAADGRSLVAAFADGTLHWRRASDGQVLLTLFVNRDTRAWVVWTPSGYYMASPGGEDMIGWHLNRGWDQAADFFPASRFRDRFNRPDVVKLILDTQDEDAAVKQANTAARRRDDSQPIIERLPPVLTIVSPQEGSPVEGGTVEIRYATRSPSGMPVDRIEAFVDGARIAARGLARVEAAPGTITLPMPPHDTTISLVAYAGSLAGDAVRIGLKAVAAPAQAPDALKPVLYALLVGVTHYDNAAFDLGYPAKDATDLAATLQSQKGKLYKDVVVKILTDKDATATAVKRGLLWLQKQTTARDLAIVFVAGHGTTDAKGKFWFLTSDADPEALSVTAVSKDDITDVLYDLPGKKLLFLDACHAGAALNAGTRGLERTPDLSSAVNDFAQAEGGVVAYAASTGHEFSFERDEWGHGAFTKALIEGFGGKADLLHQGTISTATLEAFVDDRVKTLTGGQQHPVMTRPKTVPDFPIALVP